MANRILAGDPLLINDISILARVFERSLDYFYNHSSLLDSAYLEALRTVVGLSYTVVLADGYLRHAFEPYLARFLAAQEELDVHPKSRKRMGHSCAQMVRIATLCFYKRQFPPYYSYFVAMLRVTLMHDLELGLNEEIERILNYLSIR